MNSYLWRSCSDVIPISGPFRSRWWREYWKPLSVSVRLMGGNLLSHSVSVCRKSNSWNKWWGKSVRLLAPKSSSCRVASRPANAAWDRLVRPQPWTDSSRILASRNASDWNSVGVSELWLWHGIFDILMFIYLGQRSCRRLNLQTGEQKSCRGHRLQIVLGIIWRANHKIWTLEHVQVRPYNLGLWLYEGENM
jgi:hypothetical protein